MNSFVSWSIPRLAGYVTIVIKYDEMATYTWNTREMLTRSDIDPYRANRKYKKWYTTKEFTGVVGELKLSFPNSRSLQLVSSIFTRRIDRAGRKSYRSRVNRVQNDIAEKFPSGWSIYGLYLGGIFNNLFSYDNKPTPAKWGRFDSASRQKSPRFAIPHTDDVISLWMIYSGYRIALNLLSLWLSSTNAKNNSSI